MAVPTITPGFDILSTCDATTGWSAGTVDTELFKQGTASLSGILRTSGLNTRTYTSTSQNVTGKHLRLWLFYGAVGFLDTAANGGIRLFIQDTGGSIGYWYLGGSDTYGGGWVLLTVDCDRAFDSGTANRTTINRFGFALQLTGSPRNATNTWYDYLVLDNGTYTVTGGTSGDPVTWSTLAAADNSAGYGVVQRINGITFVNSAVTFGNSTGNIYFEDTAQTVAFVDAPVNSSLYKIVATGGTGTTSFKMGTKSGDQGIQGCTITAAGSQSYAVNLGASTINTLGLYGCTFNKAGTTTLPVASATREVLSCAWQQSGEVLASTVKFQYNSVIGATLRGLRISSVSHQVSDCQFIANPRAIHFDVAGTYTLSGVEASGNTYDVENSTTGTVTINAINGTNVASSLDTAGGTTVIVNAKSFSVTNIIENSEVRILRQSDLVELGGVENIATTPTGINNVSTEADPDNAGRFRLTYSYNYASDTPIFVVVLHLNYLPIYQSSALRANDSSLLVNQIGDRQYF